MLTDRLPAARVVAVTCRLRSRPPQRTRRLFFPESRYGQGGFSSTGCLFRTMPAARFEVRCGFCLYPRPPRQRHRGKSPAACSPGEPRSSRSVIGQHGNSTSSSPSLASTPAATSRQACIRPPTRQHHRLAAASPVTLHASPTKPTASTLPGAADVARIPWRRSQVRTCRCADRESLPPWPTALRSESPMRRSRGRPSVITYLVPLPANRRRAMRGPFVKHYPLRPHRRPSQFPLAAQSLKARAALPALTSRERFRFCASTPIDDAAPCPEDLVMLSVPSLAKCTAVRKRNRAATSPAEEPALSRECAVTCFRLPAQARRCRGA